MQASVASIQSALQTGTPTDTELQTQFTASQASIANLNSLTTSLTQQGLIMQEAISSIQSALLNVAVTDNDLQTHITEG